MTFFTWMYLSVIGCQPLVGKKMGVGSNGSVV